MLVDEENKEQETAVPEEQKPEIQTAEVLGDLKKNYVRKDDYDKVIEENGKLAKMILDGTGVPSMETKDPEEKPDIAKLRTKLFDIDNPLSNLEYCKTALELRKAIIDEGGEDPFLPCGHNANGVLYSPTEDDRKKAQNVADIMEHCIEYAEGDSEAFTNELMRLTKDAMPTHFKKK